ncbi:hypothetical protein [Bacillus sp. UMB0728]|uniref:hypothetical protein n=1 Tax=Bacillus sp. UMB0728 TaxID=2066052 RepID=UPI000C7628AB|nr:hypothetical protein [Bacillus sp. UMB0728]PLR72331.1 hypothetical protein CYJ37_12305 [Bacillus sp. UMB0728]
MTAFIEKVAEYPNSNFVTFRFANLGRSSYDGTQYNVYNTTTGWSSGWTNTPPVSYNGYYSSNFNISLSPGYSYMVYSRMMVNGVWYYGDGYYEPVSFYFTPSARPPTDRPAIRQHSASGTTIYMIVDNAYGATSIQWNTPFGTYTRSVQSTPYTEAFYAPSYGTEYIIGAIGINASGSTGEKLAYALTETQAPSITSGGTAGNNTIVVNVSPRSGFDLITVEMWDINAQGMIASKTQGWNGGSAFTVQFAGLVQNASYLFRAKASKTRSDGTYTSTSPYGGWLTIKNEAARPENWKWTTAANSNGHKISGVQFSMLASEWNAFANRINAFRSFKGLSNYNFTSAIRGSDFYFYIFNEANTAIGAMRSTGISNVTRGSQVYASYFNALMNALNGVT